MVWVALGVGDLADLMLMLEVSGLEGGFGHPVTL
jgi:hypothetical protein